MEHSSKRPASPSSTSQSVNPHKRQRRTANVADSNPGSSSCTPKEPRSLKKNQKLFVWGDIPKEWAHNRCPILELLPVELFDKIIGSESRLELQDHMALAGTCRTLREVYTDEVWKALLVNPASPTANHIFARGVELSQQQVVPDDKGKPNDQDAVPGFPYREMVIEKINTPRITKTLAMQTFKVSAKDMAPLKFEEKPNPHTGRRGHPMRLYITAQVRALALRVHGGPLGHAAHLRKVADTAQKSKATRAKNGTAPKKKDPTDSPNFPAAEGDYAYDDYICDDYAPYPFY